VTLDNPLSFTECALVAVRGWNKVNMFTSISAEIKDCNAFDPILINPRMVIDAVGTQKIDPGRRITPKHFTISYS
jgi:hypothetical protein